MKEEREGRECRRELGKRVQKRVREESEGRAGGKGVQKRVREERERREYRRE